MALRRRLSRILVCVLLSILAGFALSTARAQGPQAHQPTALDMLAALNAWRLEENLAPFRPNRTLEALAMLQARYLLAQPDIPENLHDGITGERPRVRALWPPFSWPYYDIQERINLTEIIVAQHTVEEGIEWWKNSPIHRRAATNPNYREAGVAALPYPYGTLFVAVLGGRPDVFPALIHPDGQTLYLTRETFWGATGDAYLTDITRVRLLDADGAALTGWQRWQPTLPIPAIDGEVFYVEYSDGRRSVRTEVNVERDVFPLPGYLEALAAASSAPEAETALVAASQVPAGANVRLVAAGPEMLALRVDTTAPLWLSNFQVFALTLEAGSPVSVFEEAFGSTYAAPGSCFIYVVQGAPLELPATCTGQVVIRQTAPEERFWYDPAREARSGLFMLSGRGRLLANCMEPEAECSFYVAAASPPSAAGGGGPAIISRRITLLYNPNSFTLVNSSGQNLDLSGLRMTDGTRTFSALTWNSVMRGASLWWFPTGDCLQVWEFGASTQPKPSTCAARQGWTTVQAGQVFWRGSTFQVINNGQVVTDCEVAAGQCTFELP